jgi:dipeptidyl aminopeptidase/acylaminoacyl peptidase
MDDEEVPPATAEALAGNLNGDDVEVMLVKGAGHRFSEPEQIDILIATLEEVALRSGLAG